MNNLSLQKLLGSCAVLFAASTVSAQTAMPPPGTTEGAKPAATRSSAERATVPEAAGMPDAATKDSDRGASASPSSAAGMTNVDSRPQPQEQNGVKYVSGGFGDAESSAFKQAIGDYSVALVFSEQAGGAYLADIPVKITSDGKGPDLEITSRGPYLLLDLPDGNYQAVATHNGRSMTRDFTVAGNKGQRIGFAW